jgi:hypothetical protein
MNVVKFVLALLFGGRFLAACGHHRSARPPARESGDFATNKQLYGEEDDEGW